MTARRSSGDHDVPSPMTREDVEEAIRVGIENALKKHKPPFDIKLVASIVLPILLAFSAWAINLNSRIAIIEERQNVNSAMILKLADRIDKVDELERNNESQITQTGQIISDHIATDNERWGRVGGKREHQ